MEKVIESKSVGTRPTLVVKATLDVAELATWLGEAYGDVYRHMTRIGQYPAGPPFARYHRLDNGRFEVEAGFPVTARATGEGRVVASELPGGEVAVVTHVGPYEGMEATYEILAEWLESREAAPLGDAWEIYFSEPTDPPDTWRTDIVQPYQAAA